jgi:hypothetical protein
MSDYCFDEKSKSMADAERLDIEESSMASALSSEEGNETKYNKPKAVKRNTSIANLDMSANLYMKSLLN